MSQVKLNLNGISLGLSLPRLRPSPPGCDGKGVAF